MWRLTIIQKRKEKYSDEKEFDVTNEVMFEADNLSEINNLIAMLGDFELNKTTLKIEKVEGSEE